MIDILSNHLQASLLEKRKLSLQLSQTVLNSIIEDVVSNHYLEALDKGVSIEISADAKPVVRVDRIKFAEVVDQLIHNAIKYSPQEGKIVINIYSQNNRCGFSVTDFGLGFSPAKRDKLFQKYVKLHASTHYNAGSAGLGLTICRQIVELHGGSIVASSQGINKGATFVVDLPAI